MASVTLSDGSTTVALKGQAEVSVRVGPRLAVQEAPGGTGDLIQYLGRRSRVVTVRNGHLYTSGNEAADLAAWKTLRSWAEAGKGLTLTTLSETLIGRILHPVEVKEPVGSKGYVVELAFIEDLRLPDPVLGGIGAAEIALSEIGLEV